MRLPEEIVRTLLPLADQFAPLDAFEQLYPPRILPTEGEVTRFAPSPTGSMHLGGLFAALISERVARDSSGIFFLRIEDTDQAREVAGAREGLIRSLDHYRLTVDEGPVSNGGAHGSYGPYIQSLRTPIYQAAVAHLLRSGRAYPCFASAEDLARSTAEQAALKVAPGYYGMWALWRERSLVDVESELSAGQPFVIRFRAPVSSAKVQFTDLLKGERSTSPNTNDIVLLKQTGLPTYHLAHVVDDHFMRTSIVLRGDEWLSSVPLHLQLFEAFGWTAPHYAHIAPIQKVDGRSRRKLSKRYDAEADVAFYDEKGYPPAAIIEYLMFLASSSFEPWRRANPEKHWSDFDLSLSKVTASSGALFDFQKLNDISRDLIARMTDVELLDSVLDWAKRYSVALHAALVDDLEYTISVFAAMRSERKDLCTFGDISEKLGFFFDALTLEVIDPADDRFRGMDPSHVIAIRDHLDAALDAVVRNPSDWIAEVRGFAETLGYAPSMKLYKQEPSRYRGSVVDAANVVRVLLTSSPRSPELASVIDAMGAERVRRRLHRLAV